MTAPSDTPTLLTALQNGKLTLQGQFVSGSNYTFMGELAFDGWTTLAVYKPVRGEQPLWDFPGRSLARREVAAYVVSQALGWELVPPTVYRKRGPLGAGSLQLFIQHDPERHYFTLTPPEKERLKPAAVFDVLINNADRKGGHVLFGGDDHLWLIDHGVCFHVDDKLRTVIWDFAGQPIPQTLLEAIQLFVNSLDDPDSALRAELKPLLSAGEIRRLAARGRQILEDPRYPLPDSNRRPYPWPPV